MAKLSKAKTSRSNDRDDDMSEPYSDELNVSSPEVLEMDEEGEVVRNSDWPEKKKKKSRKSLSQEMADLDETIDEVDQEDEEEEEEEEEEDAENESDASAGFEDEADWESEDDAAVDPEDSVKRKLSTVSFGVLAKAQDSMPPQSKKRKLADVDFETEEKLGALKKRLKQLQEEKQLKAPPPKSTNKPRKSEDESDSSDQNSDQDSANGQSKGRSSKHAPTSLSTKKAVSRKRDVVEVRNPRLRDPRFDPTAGPVDREKIRKNYSFLDGYVDSEIKDLKTTLKNAKPPAKGAKKPKGKPGLKLTEEDIAAIKKELVQKESKKASQEAQDKRMDVVREHKKKEKELVRQGKKPFFLKNSDVKKQVLVKRFEGLSEGKRDKVIEKKRKRIASKERKDMPTSRRISE
ncbi:DUF947-domain-containing protein [Microthyrium microscopicum]|uniref:rRNA biogenesis protein RRP36 n=1 Tax=Microthyrium microscopicum TaxID=703497 RepID=A0A6A6UKM2_9PEZI|nr:DUF947-domain-containing protein [Microthyrium microscopicum]